MLVVAHTHLSSNENRKQYSIKLFYQRTLISWFFVSSFFFALSLSLCLSFYVCLYLYLNEAARAHTASFAPWTIRVTIQFIHIYSLNLHMILI